MSNFVIPHRLPSCEERKCDPTHGSRSACSLKRHHDDLVHGLLGVPMHPNSLTSLVSCYVYGPTAFEK